MKSFFAVLATLIYTLPVSAATTPGRSLPSGEDLPSVIERIFSSSEGEVQFVRMGLDGFTALFRNQKGNLMGLREIRGPGLCDEWLTSEKEEDLPRGCEFVFHDEHNAGLQVVHSEEMEEASLFQAVKGKLRGVNVAL
jgi:hypothetical protein